MILFGCSTPLDIEDLDELDSPRPTSVRKRRAIDEPPPPPKEKKPLVVEWPTKRSFSTKGTVVGGGTISVSGFRGKYHITLERLPKHSKWKVGDQHGRIGGFAELIDLEIDDKLASRTFAELEKVDPEAELELALQDGRTGKVKLPPIDVTYMVHEKLKKIENGPVTFGKEPDDPKKQDSLIFPGGIGDDKLFGRAGKLHEIDWVLVANKLPGHTGEKTCGGYRDNAGKAMRDMTLLLKQTEAVIYDRRTGEVVEKKTFAADTRCPMFTMTRAGQRTMESHVPYRTIAAWARTRVKRS